MSDTDTMKRSHQVKATTVAELAEQFTSAQATVLTDYRGLTVSELKELRRSLGPDTTYAVAKNTLTKRAAYEAGFAEIADLLVGPTAVAFVGGDPVEAAKGLRGFSKAHPSLVIKGGLVEGRKLSAAEMGALADLESREVILSRLAGAMTAGMAKTAAVLSAPAEKLARLAQALADKKAANGESETE